MTTFVVDAMLGRVALWLRLTGNDTLYAPDMDDDELLQVAASDRRVLLTSDGELYERATRRGLDALLLRGPVDEVVAEVFDRFGIEPKVDPSRARCSKCNGELVEVSGNEKEVVRGLVFEQTFEHYDTFWLCHDCNAVYFQGAYWKNITGYMERIRSLIARRRLVGADGTHTD